MYGLPYVAFSGYCLQFYKATSEVMWAQLAFSIFEGGKCKNHLGLQRNRPFAPLLFIYICWMNFKTR